VLGKTAVTAVFLLDTLSLPHRSIDEILVNTIDTSLPTPSDLPSDIADELAAMHLLSDAALWAASQPLLSANLFGNVPGSVVNSAKRPNGSVASLVRGAGFPGAKLANRQS
jgi:hypothetical protein